MTRGALAAAKAAFATGSVFNMTNHYIKREDHPFFGTRQVTVEGFNSNSLKLDTALGLSSIEWPKASQVEVMDDGDTVKFYGGGTSQSEGDLFLTFTRVG